GALERVRSEDFHPETEVVLPGRNNQDPEPGKESRAAMSDIRVAPDFGAAQISATASGHLLFSRTYFSAWKANLDGKPARLLVANGRDLAVAVPAGSHRVVLEYDRKPFPLGVFLQAAAVLSILCVCLHFQSRRSGPPNAGT